MIHSVTYLHRRDSILAVRKARQTGDIMELLDEVYASAHVTKTYGVEDLEIDEDRTHPLVVACWESFGSVDQDRGMEALADREYDRYLEAA